MSQLALPVRAYVENFMRSAFPDRDFSRGSAINDLVVKAFAAILQPLRHEIDTVKVSQSVSNWQYMSREAMDGLAANWGKFRQSGSRATGQVRLYFETATDYQINYLEFYSTDGVSYVLASPINISAVELLKNKRGDGTYVFDVTVVSVGLGNKYAAAAGSVVGMNNPPQGIIRCENVQDFVVTAPNESNFDVVNSMYRNLGLRNLVSRQSIRAPLYEQFPGLLDIHITGSQDEKMIRDRITVDVGGVSTEVRLGGMSDIWVNTTGVVARQVQFAYTPSTQKFKLVSDQQAAKTELVFSTPRVYLTLEGEFAAPDFLASIYELDESCQVVFDQGGLSSTSLVTTPKYHDRYTVATRDLTLGETMIVFPARYTNTNRYVTDVIGIPFDTVQAQDGDLLVMGGLPQRALQVSPRVLELAPGTATDVTETVVYSLPVTTPAGSREIPHALPRTTLLPSGSIFQPGQLYYPGQRLVIVGSGAAGHYRLIDWSDEDGNPSETTGDFSYNHQKFFIGNIVAECALTTVTLVTPTTFQYTIALPPPGSSSVPGFVPTDVDTTCWAYRHGGADVGVFDPRNGSLGEWLPILAVERTATSVKITLPTDGAPSALDAHVTIVQGLRGDLTPNTPIYFENDSAAGHPSSIETSFANTNARYINLVSVTVNPGTTTFVSPGLGAVASDGDLLVFEALATDATMIALAGNTGEVQWTTPIASVIDDNTVVLGLTPPVAIQVGTAFTLVRNSQVNPIFGFASPALLGTTITPTGTTAYVASIAAAGQAQVGDRITFTVPQQIALSPNNVTQNSPSITTGGIFYHAGIGDLMKSGDVISVPAAAYTAVWGSRIDEDHVQLSVNPVSAINNGVIFSITRPGTVIQVVMTSKIDDDHIVFTPATRQTIPSATPVRVTRDVLALASAYVTAASEASISATLNSLTPSGQSWPLGLGDGSGLPLRITNPRSGKISYRTVRFSTGGAVRKIELKAPLAVVPLTMSASGYVPAQDQDIGQTVSQKLARTFVVGGALGSGGASLTGTILTVPSIQTNTRPGDIVTFTVGGVFYSATILSYPTVNEAQLDGLPITLLSTAAITVGGGVTSGAIAPAYAGGGVFTNAGIVATSAFGDTFEFAIVGVPFVSTVSTLSAPDTIQLATSPAYNIPSGTVFKHLRPATPGATDAFNIWRTSTTITFNGTLRNYDNSTYTWYVEPNDPARDVFIADMLSTVTVANKQETNLIASVAAAQPFGYVAPLVGDIGTIVRQGSYAGVLTGFVGQTWEVKPLTDQDIFDDLDSVTFVDYQLSPNNGKIGSRGYGNAAAVATTTAIHTTGSTAITLDAAFPFNVQAVPAADDPNAVTSCVIEVLSRNGRTGFMGDGQKARIAPYAILNPDDWGGVDVAATSLLALQGTTIGTYSASTTSPYVANTTTALETIYTHIPNVIQNKAVTTPSSILAGSTTLRFAGSLIGAWGHQGRVLKLTVNGTDYFHTIDHPIDADTVALAASEPTIVPLEPTTNIAVEVVDAFITPIVWLLNAGVHTYRLVRPPAVLEPIDLPLVGNNGTEVPSTNQFLDGLQDFGHAIGGYDPSGTVREVWLALDSGNDASLVSKAITALVNSTELSINPGDLVHADTGVQYRILRRAGWLAMEDWLPGTISDGSHITVLKSALPAGWSWTRNGTFGQWGLHIARDTSTAGPTTQAWEMPHTRIVSATETATTWILELDLTHPNGLNFVTGVFEFTTGFQPAWYAAPVRFMLRVLDRTMVRNIRANGVETYNYYAGPKFVLPLVRILAVEVIDPSTQTPVGAANYDFVVADPGLRYSSRETNQLILTDPNMHLKPIRVTYLCDATIEAMDNFVNNDDVRVLNCNQVVKRMETIAVDLQIQVKSTRSQADLVQLLSSYINTLASTARVSKDGIVQFLYSQGVVTYINMGSMRIDGYYYPAENGVPVVYANVNEVFGASTAAYIAGNVSVTLVSE